MTPVAPLNPGVAAVTERIVERSRESRAAYLDRIAAAKGTIFASGCSSWYLDREGVPMTWPWSYQAFAEAMASPVMEDMERRNSKRVAV